MRGRDETSGENGKLTETTFPLMHAMYRKDEGGDPTRSAFDDVREFKYKGIELSASLIDASDGADSARRSETYCQRLLIKETNALFAALLHFWHSRALQCTGAPRQYADGERTGIQTKKKDTNKHQDSVDAHAFIKLLALCFDLRYFLPQLEDGQRSEGETHDHYLTCLWETSLKRYDGRAELAQVLAASDDQIWGPTLPPSEDDLWAQMVVLRKRLLRLFVETPELFAVPEDKDGLDSADIKAVLFTHPAFETGCEDILCLLLFCLTMGSCEAIVEGVGSIVNRNADPVRHLSPELYNAAAKVQINGPVMAEADSFIWAFLSRRFPQTDAQRLKGLKGPLNAFIHTSIEGQKAQGARGGLGLVLGGVAAQKSRLPFMV